MSDALPTPEQWGPEDYARWVRRIVVFYSEHGARLDKLILSSEMEVNLMNVHMRFGDAVVSVDNKTNMRLMGVAIRFAKLPWHRAMFVLSPLKEAA